MKRIAGDGTVTSNPVPVGEEPIGSIVNAGASEVRTAVEFKTGSYEPDFHALATTSTIVLPWDREVIVDGALVLNPAYADALREV